MSAKAIQRAMNGDPSKVKDEVENKYDDILNDADIILLENAVAKHLLGSAMDAKVHNQKMRDDGGWAEHLRKKGLLPAALQDVFGNNVVAETAASPHAGH